ncbi:MAG: hypothetical protein K0R54_3580 [Clostridiaceae bacterium]|nr:hypothetical protein [Clostridiaceae bacterium]
MENIEGEKLISGNKYELKLRNELNQSSITKECAEWIEKKLSSNLQNFQGLLAVDLYILTIIASSLHSQIPPPRAMSSR